MKEKTKNRLYRVAETVYDDRRVLAWYTFGILLGVGIGNKLTNDKWKLAIETAIETVKNQES